jgi:ABC-type transport system involved in cytochrome bd biosynthesis fused ATPase/permease subunit
VVASLVFAWAAMGMTVLIPWLVGAAVDAINEADRDALLPLFLAIVGAGILRLGLTVVRRLIAGKVSVAVEFDLRERFYGHLQTLELGFFDGQQTGQLMSRATVDLQSIRFFLGYGLIFLTQSALTIVLAGVVMFAINPWLAALALLPVPFVVFTAARYNRLSRPAVQEVQQRVAELTAEAEESVSGIRVVKAFAREEHMLQRFRRSVERVFDQNVYSTRLRAFYSPALGFLPGIGLAVVLYVGGREVISGGMSLGEFTALYTYLVMLTGPMRWLGMALGMAQRAIASGNRLFEILDREPRVTAPPGAPALPAGPGRVEFRGVSLRYGGADSSLREVDLDVPAGRTVALVGPTGSGKTSLVALLARLYDPSEGSVQIDGADLRTLDAAIESQVEAAFPLRRIGAGIVDRDLVADRLGIFAREPLDRVQLARVRHAAAIHPEALVEPHAVDDERVAFPMADRVAVVTRLEILQMLASVHVDGAKRVRAADIEDEDALDLGQVHELDAVRRLELPRGAARFAARVRLELVDLPRVVESPRPRLKRRLISRVDRVGDAEQRRPYALLFRRRAPKDRAAIGVARRRARRRSVRIAAAALCRRRVGDERSYQQQGRKHGQLHEAFSAVGRGVLAPKRSVA